MSPDDSGSVLPILKSSCTITEVRFYLHQHHFLFISLSMSRFYRFKSQGKLSVIGNFFATFPCFFPLFSLCVAITSNSSLFSWDFFLPRFKNEFQVPKWPIKFQQANLSGVTYLDCNPFSHYFFCKTLLWLSGRRVGLAIGLSWVRVPQSFHYHFHYLDLFLGRPGSQILIHACK